MGWSSPITRVAADLIQSRSGHVGRTGMTGLRLKSRLASQVSAPRAGAQHRSLYSYVAGNGTALKTDWSIDRMNHRSAPKDSNLLELLADLRKDVLQARSP